MERSDLSFLESIFGCSIANIPVSVLVVNQSLNTILDSDYDHIKVINDKSYGLSRSRNLAIQYASKELLWILDDDVVIAKNAFDNILKVYNLDDNVAIMIYRIVLENGSFFRNYKNLKVIKSIADLIGLCSIEMVLNKSYIQNYNLKFNENFGLGTDFPVGEEFLYAAQLFKAGAKIKFNDAAIVIHSSNHSAKDVMNPNILAARGAIYKILYRNLACFYELKYTFFLWRKGFIKSVSQFVSVFKMISKSHV